MLRKSIVVCIAIQFLLLSVARANSITGTKDVHGKHDGQGTTTNPDIICKLILLSHGFVECQLTLKIPLHDTRWVQFVLRDGTENRILSTSVTGTKNKEGSLRTYRVTMKRTSIKNSYFLVEKNASKVLLETVELHEAWTHGQALLSWTEEHALGSLGTPEYDSRKEKGDSDKSYVLIWRFGGIKDLSIQFKDKKAVSHWRGSPSK